MQLQTVTGIDIGTHAVKVVIAEVHPDSPHLPRVIGTGYAKTVGMRTGFVNDPDEVLQALKQAITQAQRASGVTIQQAYVGYGGAGLQEVHAHSKLLIAQADGEVTEADLDELKRLARQSVHDELVNRRILHSFRVDTILDDMSLAAVGGDPLGMKGSALKAHYLFITALEQHLQELQALVEEAGIETKDIVATPVAASLVTLTKTLSIPGCALIDIGAETTTLLVFENDTPTFLKVFPVGAANVTHDLALKLQIPLIEAEQIKLGSLSNTEYPKKKINDIITNRYKDIFKTVQAYLKERNKAGLLPAGALLLGAGAQHPQTETIAKAILKIPAERVSPKTKARLTPALTAAYGLCVYGAEDLREKSFLTGLKPLQSLSAFIKKFLP